MAFNRLRDFNFFKEVRLSQEETGQTYLFGDLGTPETETEPVVRRRDPSREEVRTVRTPPVMSSAVGLREGVPDQLVMLLDKCMELVSRDPEVAHNGPRINWDLWFSQPLLSAIRRAGFPTGLKQRLLAFMALMLPFLENQEQERVRCTLVEISPDNSSDFGEILTEQDLIHTQWLVQSIRRSEDIQGQMEALRRSILRSLSLCRVG